MTAERVDHDRLADFVGGALDGTPDEAQVRALIDSDPSWAAAHDELAAATARVSTELRAVGARTDAVPEDVAARLAAALRPVESEPRAAGAPRAVTHDGPARDQVRPGPGGPGRARRARRARWVAGLSAVAAVIAVGIGFFSLVPTMRSSDSGSGGAADSAGVAAPNVAGGPPTVVSSRDYSPGSFNGLGAGQPGAPRVEGEAAPPGSTRQGGPSGLSAQEDSKDMASTGGVPPELARLTDPAARQDCLAAIVAAHGGTPQVVEYARFTGRPALIVQLAGATSGNGGVWVVVAGPDCGRVPGDVDELYNGPLS